MQNFLWLLKRTAAALVGAIAHLGHAHKIEVPFAELLR
jgi:hypothetical protein